MFFATLLRQLAPEHEIVVFERNRPDNTFGFGVVFSDATLSNLGDADPVLTERLGEQGQSWEQIEVRAKGEVLRCGGNGMAAIARRQLLDLLYRRAAEVGVVLRFQKNIVQLSDLQGFDLVVGSDGANSMVRNVLSKSFGPAIHQASAKFIWFGTTYRFRGLTFLFENSPYGVFAVHGYPIDENTGTFIVETDEETWAAAGMDRFDVAQPPGPSDIGSKEYLESLFSQQIEGCNLLVNNSRWASFRTVRNRAWHSGNVVLLGDSAHTAHFSVGSGTKMAMEDGAALAFALSRPGMELEEALDQYEKQRRPSVEGIQGSAAPSLSWWENFGSYYRVMEPAQFAYHFFTRAISGDRVRRRDAEFVNEVARWWERKHGADPLHSPMELSGELSGMTAVSRLVLVREISAGLAEAEFLTEQGRQTLLLESSESPASRSNDVALISIPSSFSGYESARGQLDQVLRRKPALVGISGGTVLERALLSERARLSANVPSLVIEDELDIDAALTTVLSGRADFVGGRKGPAFTEASQWPTEP